MTYSTNTHGTVRPKPRRSRALPVIAAVLAGGLLAACQSVSGHAPGPQTTTGARAEASQGLNSDWGSCEYRRCDFGK